jgi:hypothetical protein
MPRIDPDQVRALAHAEAEAAFAEGWRSPSKKAVAKALGISKGMLSASDSNIADVVFTALLERQNALIASTAEALRAKGVDPSNAEIAAVLGIKADVLRKGQKTRFKAGLYKVKPMRVRKLPEVDETPAAARPLPPPERNCLCGCIGRTDGRELIQGYLPECWAEYGRWRAIDEGRRQRVA